MKEGANIFFLTLATLMFLVLTIVPHHHHNGGVCIIKEKCEQDSAISDKLTGHTHNDKSHSRSCSLESAFAIRKTDDGIKCKVHSCDNPQHFHIFPILYLGVDFLLYPEVSSSSQPEWGNNVSFYTSAEASQFHGLRAPPHILA